jgi:hypothetical protein
VEDRRVRKFCLIVTTTAIAALAGAAAATDKPASGSLRDRPCFASNTWEGWSASADGDAIYLKVGLRDIYRVDLARGSHVRKDPDKFLINRVRGSNWICDALDLDLTLADHHGFREPVFAHSLRKLTPAEIAAIPRKELP